MKNCDTCGAPVNDAGKFAKADHLDTAGLSAQLATALAATASAQAEVTAQKVRADKAEAERDTAKDAAAAADQARKDAVDQGPALARARVKLEDKAVAVLGAEFKADGKTDDQLRRAVVEKLTGKPLGAELSADYVTARYDGAIETLASASQHVDAARGAGARTDGKPAMTEAEAMAEAKRKADARSQPRTA